jgi:signal transduction histidine kinase
MSKVKTILLSIALSFIFCLPAFSQNQAKLDSLEKALRKLNSDSARILTLVKLSEEYEYIDYNQAKKYADQALTIAETKNWAWAKGVTYKQQATLNVAQGNYTTALKFDNLRLTISVNGNDSTQIASALNNVGDDFFGLGEFDESYYYFTQSYRVASAIRDSARMAIALLNVGSVLKELGQYENAVNHLELSQKISAKFRVNHGEAYYLDEMGDIYQKQNDFGKAEEFLLKSLKLTRAQKLNDLEPHTLSSLANVYYDKNDLERASLYYDTVFNLHAKTQNVFGQSESNLGKGKVLLKQGKFKEALALIDKTFLAAQQINARTLEINCLAVLAGLYEQQGDYKKSLAYYKQYQSLQDSLFSQDMLDKLFQDQLRFATETKDNEITALSKARSAQDEEMKEQDLLTNILIVVSTLSAILLFTVYRSGSRRKRINELLLEHQEDIKKRSIELEQLNQVKDKFFSIISHDLRSPVNALGSILDLIDSKNLTIDEFTRLTKELRIQVNHTKTLITNLLDWALLQMDNLKIQAEKINLKRIVDDNAKLLSSMHMKLVKIVNNIPETALGFADLNMINLVFRNLILNGIKFTEDGGQITISSRDDGDYYTISIADNGVGIRPEIQSLIFTKTTGYSTRGTANEKGTGLGLILCKEFVERNGGKIWLESEMGQGSTFFFTIKKPA